MELPNNFVKNVILRQNCKDIMNTMARSVLEMAAYDEDPTDVSTPHVLKQCMKIIATLPLFAVYGYHAYNHYDCNKSLIIHRPDHNLSMAENILMMLRPDGKFTATEAEALDNALIIQIGRAHV